MRPIDRILTPTRSRKALLLNGTYDGSMFVPSWSSTPTNNEEIGSDFEAYVDRAYKGNGIVFACATARMLPFTEARFAYQQLIDGRPGNLFSGPGLGILEAPWANATTGDLLARMEQDGGTLAGNAYIADVRTESGRRLRRLRPDWVTIVSGVIGDPDAAPGDLETEVLGYLYAPPKGRKVLLTVDRVAHYAPIPDPMASWRGMSWLTPVLREVEADTAATVHKAKFFKNGATPSFVVRYDASVTPENLRAFIELFKQEHTGSANAYKVLHLGGGADATTVGANMQQLDFKATQGAGETRIAAASGVGSIIARLSEGMQGSALNQGNYGAAKRQFADMTLRPLWRSACGALAKFADVPDNARLWTDVRDVSFLAEDSKDEAEINSANAATIRTLIEAGYKPDDAIRAVTSGDYLSHLIGGHTGLVSVQLQPAGQMGDLVEDDGNEDDDETSGAQT